MKTNRIFIENIIDMVEKVLVAPTIHNVPIFFIFSNYLTLLLATHSSVLAWRIPGTGEPGGLLSLGSHRVRHD